MDPDSTIALLATDLPRVPGARPRPCSDVEEDDEEKEVFFGPITDKERRGVNAKFNGRPTLDPNEVLNMQRRSWQITPKSDIKRELKADVQSENKNPNVPSTIGEESEDTFDLESGKINAKMQDLCLKSRSPLKDEARNISGASCSSTELDSDISRSPQSSRLLYSNNSLTRIEETEESELPSQNDLHGVATFSPESVGSLNSSTASNWFDNTHDEMILYEKFGDNYDEVVGRMSNQEKRKLKKEVVKMTPKPLHELIEDENEILEDPTFENLNQNSHSPLLTIQAPTPPKPKPRTLTPKKNENGNVYLKNSDTIETRKNLEDLEKDKEMRKNFSPRLVKSETALKSLKDELTLALTPTNTGARKISPEKNKFQTYSRSPQRSPTLPQKHTPSRAKASHLVKTPVNPSKANVFKTPTRSATRPMIQKSHYGPTPSPSYFKGHLGQTPSPSYLRATFASKYRSVRKKDPDTNETLDVTLCCRHGYSDGEMISPVNTEKKKSHMHH